MNSGFAKGKKPSLSTVRLHLSHQVFLMIGLENRLKTDKNLLRNQKYQFPKKM